MLFLLQLKLIMFIEARIYIIHAFVNTRKSLYCVYVCVVFKLKSLWISWPATVSCTSKNLGEGTSIDEVPSLFLSEHQYWWGGQQNERSLKCRQKKVWKNAQFERTQKVLEKSVIFVGLFLSDWITFFWSSKKLIFFLENPIF